ncbi:Protein TWIN LOV 1 [Acorus calamus]|uniref:Protein TWIN LOV 1 n=1 Tax=Acorus calamus TaxID=4465 RepID=A0AAV9C0T9_ACOCL|nr:Protein TWIN LOV 1 [Acorus calamus]
MESSKSRLDRLIDRSMSDRYSQWFRDVLDEIPGCFLITDPSIPGHPIVFASRGFLGLTGYAEAEVLGKNGRVFQGPKTNRRSVAAIREAIREERTVQIGLLNYRKDGTPYEVWFNLCPVFGEEDGKVVHFVAVQVPMSRKGRGTRRRSSGEKCCGSCRREVLLEMIGELGGIRCFLIRMIKPLTNKLLFCLSEFERISEFSSPGLGSEDLCEATEEDKQKAASVINDLLSALTRFLSGPDTDIGTLCEIRDNIKKERAFSVRILNYRKDGSSFWNFLHISPVRNACGKVAFYVGVQIDESSKTEGQGLSPQMRQLGAVGAIKVAVRSLSAGVGPCKSS